VGGGGRVREKVMIAQRIDYAKHRSRSHDAVIRVYDPAGNVIAPLRTAFLFCLPQIN
jgi:hypothetical protein